MLTSNIKYREGESTLQSPGPLSAPAPLPAVPSSVSPVPPVPAVTSISVSSPVLGTRGFVPPALCRGRVLLLELLELLPNGLPALVLLTCIVVLPPGLAIGGRKVDAADGTH